MGISAATLVDSFPATGRAPHAGRRTITRTRRRLRYAIPFATALTAFAGTGAAHAQNCDAHCTQQAADQETLLKPFNDLLSTQAGKDLLTANLQKEVDIYLNSTQADKIASGTILITSAVPANVLMRAFPGNPNYGYDSQGIPTAPKLPPSIAATVVDVLANVQIIAIKPYFGVAQDTYGIQYGYLPGQSDSLGNPPPYQVSAQILGNPFTPQNSSTLAWQNQQTPGAYGINWVLGDSKIGDFPSAHTVLSTVNAIPYAILAPGYYQQLAYSVVNFTYDLNVFAVHYPTDIIGGRILTTYVIAKMLADDPLYASSVFNQYKLPALSRDMQAYFGGGGSSPYAAACAGNVASCIARGVIPSAATFTQQGANYVQFLTYGLPSVGTFNPAPIVPTEAHYLIATRFPYLNATQLDEIIASTELPAGVPLDDGTTGWARINLFAAAGGYGAFVNNGNVTVNMNAALGGLNAFDVWSNNISGPGGLTLQGTGTLVLAGNNTYTGGTNVEGGTLAVSGSLAGNVAVSAGATFILGSTATFTGNVTNSGSFSLNGSMPGKFSNSGLLSGNGSIGTLDLLPGSVVAPGNSVGTITVAGKLTVAAGTTYQVQVEGNDADQIQAGGTATLNGGTVVASLIGYHPVLGHPYQIVTAAGGISGAFETATPDNLPFIQPSLGYDTQNAFLTLTRSDVPFASVATSPNQVAVANALDAGPAAHGLGLAVTTQTAVGAQRAFDALSGEVHASAQSVMLNDSLYVRDALLSRMRQASFAGSGGATAALATGGPTMAYAAESEVATASLIEPALAHAGGDGVPVKAAAAPATTYWTQAVGAWGRFGSDGNAAGARHTLAGFFSGVDCRFGPDWLGGIAGGYTHPSVSVGDRASSAVIETAHLAGYAAGSYGPWNLRAAVASSFSTLATSRTIAFPGFSDTATARYNATTAQVFGEASYGVALGRIAAEWFGGLAVVHSRIGGFAEASGSGIAALSGSASNGIAYSTLGGRVASGYIQANGMVVTPRLSASWQHAAGPVNPTQVLTFQSTGAPFAIAGLPLARDTALVESGVDLRLTPQARVGLSYSAQLANHVQYNSVQGNLTWQF